MSGQRQSPVELYLRDLAVLLKERAREARQQRMDAEAKELGFAVGRLMAFHEVISLMQQQADAFGIDRKEIGLNDIEPERDLV